MTESALPTLAGSVIFFIPMPNNKVTVKQAKQYYLEAFPRKEKCKIVWSPAPSGHVLTIIHNDEIIDTVLVRYDLKIFRDYIQVYPEVSR